MGIGQGDIHIKNEVQVILMLKDIYGIMMDGGKIGL